VINIAGIMMDETVFRNPKTFDPYRFDVPSMTNAFLRLICSFVY
jgi:cytochrome P450